MDKEKEKTDEEAKIIEKNKEAKLVRRIVFITISVLTIIIAISIYSLYKYVDSSLKPLEPENDEEIYFEIPIGTSSSQIAEILEENKLIKDVRVFKYYLKFRGGAEFQAGNYALPPSLSLSEIIEELQKGKVIDEPIYTITIPEGKTLEEIAKIMAEKLKFTEEEFITQANDPQFLEELMTIYPELLSDKILQDGIFYPLEGYLFAGTYEIFDDDPSVDWVIREMVDRTHTTVNTILAETEEADFNVHEILTLASVIEKESKFPEDRPKVSQVFLNRLQDGMRLQSDVTAAYANREHKIVMTFDDIETDSPFNTYVTDGLPIGPIDSPSVESMKAVIAPEGDDFTELYFYARPSGETFYRNTLDEHNQVKEKYEHEWHELDEEMSKDEE